MLVVTLCLLGSLNARRLSASQRSDGTSFFALLSVISLTFLESPELEVLSVQVSVPALPLLSLLSPSGHSGRLLERE